MTSKTPADRFKQHKTGYINKKGVNISSSIVQKYGCYLRPSLYDEYNLTPMTRKQALAAEEKLALELRKKGYAVGLIRNRIRNQIMHTYSGERVK